MSGQFDPKSAAALAERLDTQINGMWGLVTSHPHIVSPQFLEFLMEVAAALRQRPQEERPKGPKCLDCGKPTGDDKYDLCESCEDSFHKMEEASTKSQAPEERPDLIALLEAELPEWKGELYDRGFAEGFGRAIGRLKELSALRAQPAPAERTALERTWQPIETAPHVIGAEGCILAWWPESYTVSTVAWWDGKKWISDHVESEIGQPTHWMPLQAGPQARQE